MKIINLDDAIEGSRKRILKSGKLDLSDHSDALSIGTILTEIKEEAARITEPPVNRVPIKHVIVPVQPLTDKSYIAFLKSIEKRLRKIGIYESHIRPAIKNKYNRSIAGKRVINGQILLKYDDSEFVDVLYRNILGREADSEGRKNNLFLLRTGAYSKVDMLYVFINGEEGKKRGLMLSGVGFPRLKNKIRRFLLKVPIAGYCLRWAINVFLLPRRISALQHKFAELAMEQGISSIVKEQEKRVTQLENQKQRLSTMEQEIYSVIKEQERKVTQIESRLADYDEERSQQNLRFENQKRRLNEIYLEYEKDLMCKSRKDTKDMLLIYLDKLENWVAGRNKGSLTVLDLGCGAGEWLELLMEFGYAPKGVDSNEAVVSDAKKQNPLLDIVVEDAVSYLKSLPDDSLDMISSLQMIEHLDLIELYELFDELKRVLKPKGMLVLVTPNAQNIITATYMFRVDPTHKNPIPVEVLQFYLKKWGFDVMDTVFTNSLNYVDYDFDTDDPLKHIVYRFNVEQDYGVLAVKK